MREHRVYGNLRDVCTSIFLLQIMKWDPEWIGGPGTDRQLIRDTAKTRGQPPQGSALEPQEEPGSQRPLRLCSWGPVCCRLGFLLLQPHGQHYLANRGFIRLLTLLCSNPCFPSLTMQPTPIKMVSKRNLCFLLHHHEITSASLEETQR